MTRGAEAGNAVAAGIGPRPAGSVTSSSIRVADAAAPRKPGLRRWQQEAARAWADAGRPQDFLAEATPGAGKTTFALHLAHEALGERHVRTLTVVCPTTHLRRQWQIAAHRAGIELCTELAGLGLDRAFRGAALTYQQVLSEPERYRRVLGGGWVILDECHHAGEGRSWADALAHAFDAALHRLSLSGTAFRSDACRIPFIRYDAAGVSVADYRYGYGEALRDGVVRPVYFVSFGGETAWYRGGRKRQAGFEHALAREDAAARLRTALDAGGGWMAHALDRANQRLQEVRLRHADAGALVVCMDQAHARKVAERLRSITGTMPAVALSDDPDASAVISRFASSRESWIVAVRQVSEGTDIPRLRVGVWATNASTELFFRQVVGRLVRVVPGLAEQDAYLYLPADPGLLRHARALSDERSHHLPEQSASGEEEVYRARAATGEASDFRALGSTGSDSEIIFGSRVLSPAELDRARAVAEQCGLTLADPLPFALALREAAGSGSLTDVTIEARRRALRSLLARRVREYCARTGASHRDIYARLKRQAGKAVSRLNEDALVRHVRMVEGWLARESRARSGVVRP